jgi:hypothetical protein
MESAHAIRVLHNTPNSRASPAVLAGKIRAQSPKCSSRIAPAVQPAANPATAGSVLSAKVDVAVDFDF